MSIYLLMHIKRGNKFSVSYKNYWCLPVSNVSPSNADKQFHIVTFYSYHLPKLIYTGFILSELICTCFSCYAYTHMHVNSAK